MSQSPENLKVSKNLTKVVLEVNCGGSKRKATNNSRIYKQS